MKRTLIYVKGLFAIMATALIISCEGPAGMDGVDANSTCKQCHNDANMTLKSVEYELSGHGAGTNVAYAGGRKSCARCHSNEGFIETLHTGMDTTAFDIPIPTRISCETCHDFHESLDFETDGPDFALRAKDPVTFIINGETVDFEASSNLCANCHQPRTAGPSLADETFRISSTHWGPHHGPQATYVDGLGAVEFSGSESYPEPGTSTHASAGACVMCHMGESTGEGSEMHGGHTFSANVANCTACHTDATSFDIGGVQTEVEGLLEEIAAVLESNNVLDAEGHVVPGTYSSTLAAAYYNYIGIEEDRSMGVHNPEYIIAVLKNTLAAIQ
ncbi:hypothetical protein [Saccharicrinis sp. FJH54]|uniref:hypothetical protein n=1 Tax=Saccharicrinis sp. FJH54 TaxID=3344665 RepID=UPI0035D3DDC7